MHHFINLTVISGVFISLGLTSPSPAPSTTTPAALADRVQGDLLQFMSAGHILGFANDGFYAASGSKAMRVEFVGAQVVTPVAESAAATDGPATPLLLVVYPDLWPGITLTYDAADGAILRSTYQLEAGADPSAIQLAYNGPLVVNDDGTLTVQYESGAMVESAPIAWQVINGQRQAVQVSFRLNQLPAAKTVGFRLGNYDPLYPVTIDPSLTWNTFLGGTGDDFGYSIAVDGSGNVYLAGSSTASWGCSPVDCTVRAYTGDGDAFVAQLDSSGNLIWNTFLGGSGSDIATSVAIDRDGNIYVAGSSAASWGCSPIDCTVRAYTDNDAFITKLTPLGDLQWNTFLGGSGGDQGWSVAVDGGGKIYVAGFSTDTWGCLLTVCTMRAYTTGNDAFVAQLDSSGNLGWNTFLGGSGDDLGYSVTVDGSGNVYAAGSSNLTWGCSPTDCTVRAFAGSEDAFAAQLDSSGNLIWNTFLGGGSYDFGFSIVVDGSENVYVAGASDLTWGCSATDCTVRAYTAAYDSFVAQLDSSGNLSWNTFLGGSGEDRGLSMAVDGAGNPFVAGFSGAPWGCSPVACTVRAFTASVSEAFAAQLDSSGNLGWNTFLGGGGTDIGYSVAVDGGGNVYVTGYGSTWDCSPMACTMRAYTAGRDAFAALIDYDSLPPLVSSSIRANANPTNTASVDFIVTFSESVTGVDASDFALTTTGVTGASVSGVSGTDDTYTVSVNIGSGIGTIRLDMIDDDSILDGASNPLGGAGAGNGDFTSGESYTLVNLTVTTTEDNTTSDTFCSLREALTNANDDAQTYGDCVAGSGDDTLDFDDALGATTITLESVLPDISDPGGLTIDGGGDITVSGNDLYRVFVINIGVTAAISNLTIENGNDPGISGGGGILNYGTLTLNNTTVSGSVADGQGGGIFNTAVGTLTLNNSTVSGNWATAGGGIYNIYIGTVTLNNSTVSGNSVSYNGGGGLTNNGTLTLNNSTVSGNSAEYDGGGIYNHGVTTLNNSTVSGNATMGHGGGILNEIPDGQGSLTVNYSTVVNNTSDSDEDGLGDGGGLYNYFGAATYIQSSILAGNQKGTSGATDASADCYDPSGSTVSIGYNLSGSGTGCALSGAGDRTVPPATVFTEVLDALTANGGPTLTHALIADSANIALNAIPSGTGECGTPPFAQDQRSQGRPFHGNCDIGAYEVQTVPLKSTRFVTKTGTDAGDCGSIGSPCLTITYAITQAAAGNRISIAAGAYPEAGITIDKDLTLIGAGADITIVEADAILGNATDRVFVVNSGATATIEGMTIQHGKVLGGTGGGILNEGTLTLHNSLVRNNDVDNGGGGGRGGGLYNTGVLTLTDSTISGNSAFLGGGIYNFGGMVTLNNSTVSDNSAYLGGGLYNSSAGLYNSPPLMLNNSTVSGNSANQGGGIYTEGGVWPAPLRLHFSTVTNNTSDLDNDGFGEGGGLYNELNSDVYLQSSIIAGNKKGASGITDATADCSDSFVPSIGSFGYNLTGSGTGCELSGTADQTVAPDDVFTDVLGALADNGGFTQTHAFIFLLNNPARDAIPGGEGSCGSAPFDLDQRGQPRPYNFNCDIGAYESQSAGIRYVATFNGADASDCSNSDNPCSSITYAITQAVVGDTINIAAGTYTEDGITIDKDLTLTGAGADNTIIQAAATLESATDRVFVINSGVTVTIDGLRIQHGATSEGGGIYNGGRLTLNNSTVSINSATYGGGIYNADSGTLTLILNNSTVNGNTANVGGGIWNWNQFGTVILNNSTVIGNTTSYTPAVSTTAAH